jgi:UDP-glucose 4-epimerase
MGKMRVLVTGGAGYIGSHTCVELIHAGYDPVIVDDFRNSDRYTIERIGRITGHTPRHYYLDCKDGPKLDRVFYIESPDAVIHFAAYKSVRESMDLPMQYYENNVGSLIEVIKAMGRANVKRLVFSSSCTVYGEPEVLPVDESMPSESAVSPYGSSKVMCERIISDMGSKLEPVILRYFNPIGAHPSALLGELPIGKPSNLVPHILNAVQHNKELVIYGQDFPTIDGTCVRDYIHVVDVARAHVQALTCDPTTVNLALGQGMSVMGIVSAFEQVNGVLVPKRMGPRQPGDVAEVWARADKARRNLKWESSFTVMDALRHAWEWQKTLNIESGILHGIGDQR